MTFRYSFIKSLAFGLIFLLLWSPALGESPRIERLPLVAARPVGDVLDRVVDEELPIVEPMVDTRRSTECWTWQALPAGLMYKSYLAGAKEPRFAAQWVKERNAGWIWDISLGGRAGILRYGTCDPLNPQGWQVDIEGAAFPRLNMEHENDLIACDYRFGLPLTHAIGPHHYKLAYYHLSSHLGDEWMLQHPGVQRINYSRDAIVFGYSYYPRPALRLYAEAAYSLGRGEFTLPWEFQFGVEYSPAEPTGLRPVPFIAIGSHLREEVDYGGNVVVQSGWQWRGPTGNLLRMGMQCFVGMSDQFEFYNRYESKVGFGIWYDF